MPRLLLVLPLGFTLSWLLACAGDPPDASEPGPSGTSDESGTTHADPVPTDPGTSGSDGEDSTGTEGGEEPTTGMVDDPSPVFVALADGGWTATSCDGGRTWVQQAFSDEVGDHTPWTAFGGLAFGHETFVAGFGWGAPGHVLASPDGLAWEDLAADRFTDQGRVVGYDAYTSAVAFDGDQFLLFSSRLWRSTNGYDWEASELTLPPGSDQVRQLRAFDDGLVVAALENQSGEGHALGNFVAVSHDGGQSWSEGSGYTPSCSNAIQHWGDLERRDGTLLVGSGDVCRSTDDGASWELVASPLGGEIQDLFVDDVGFGAVAGSRIAHSDDGVTWIETADLGAPLSRAAQAEGAWVALSPSGTQAWWSDDGGTWQPGEFVSPPGGEVWLRDLVVGYVSDCAP